MDTKYQLIVTKVVPAQYTTHTGNLQNVVMSHTELNGHEELFRHFDLQLKTLQWPEFRQW